MTRFARAKGSKASNERVPEEATSWSEMKQQLLEKNKEIEENKKRKVVLEKRNANYKAFLEEKEKDSTKNTSWAEFPGFSALAVKAKKVTKLATTTENNNIVPRQAENSVLEHKTFTGNNCDSDEPPEEQSSKKEISEPVIAKKKKMKLKKTQKITEQEDGSSNQEKNNKQGKKRKATEYEEGKRKKLKKVIKSDTDAITNKLNTSSNKPEKVVQKNLTEEDLRKIEKKKQRRIKQVEKKKRLKQELMKQKIQEMELRENGEGKSNNKNENIKVYPKKPFNKLNKFMEKRKNSSRNNEEHSRRKPFMPNKMFINGKEVEIDYVDGFPVKKEDALRLKKLRREMISKGLPRSEIDIALKLERRRAEKAFAREKKKVS